MRIKMYLPMIFIAALIWIFPFVVMASGDDNSGQVKFTASNKQVNKMHKEEQLSPPGNNPESGSIAWAHNAWTLEIYNLDIDVPTIHNVTDTVDFQTFCGDFTPGDNLHLWVIQYPDNKLMKINVSTGETNDVVDLPVPLTDGIWTSLIINKTTGAFYAIATDGFESVLYNVDATTGTTTEAFGLGLTAVISSAFDMTGNLYVFDIESDSTFVVDVSAGEVTGLGPAGFDGNYAQGMGYDPATDVIYLAAYHNEQGPQLRKLNNITGETTFVATLPGETGAFGFPAGTAGVQASAGPDVTICADQAYPTSDASASGYASLEWTTTGDGTFDDPGMLLTVYHPGENDMSVGFADLCLTAFGTDGATSVTDCLTLTTIQFPEADAGPDVTISSGEDFEISDAFAQHYSALTWSTSGDGSFANPNLLLPVYSPGPSDLNNGSVELCLTATPFDPCTTVVNACLELTIENVPEGIDFGDAPENTGNPLSFPTTLAQNGAAHSIDPSIYLGQKIDGESDGQPDLDALGDDNDLLYPSFGDDEDGVEMPQFIYQGTEVNLTISASVDGYLDAWVDFNNDQAWLGPSEHVLLMEPVVAGVNQLSFLVPPAASTGQSYIRFRFRDYPQPLDAGGFADNGEVEDYKIVIRELQAEEMDYGDAPSNNYINYPTLFTQDGARHKIVDGIYLGSFVDAEPDGQPYNAALGDDQDIYFPSTGDDEDGVNLPETAQAGSEIELEVNASVNGFLDAWMDFNRDGIWNEEEHIFSMQPVSTGSNALQVSIPEQAALGLTYLRFRFRDYAEPLAPNGLAENGEVEDYSMQITGEPATQLDFGDAPGIPGLFAYPTLLNDNGARHQIVPGICLGEFVDAEQDGQPSPDAMGDDYDLYYPSAGDDEDGVQFQGQFVPGSTTNILVDASVDGFLEAWIDFNRDGDWSDAAEHIFSSQVLVQGSNALSINVPENAETGNTFVRFRFSDYDAQPGPAGLSENGEVEDYMILIQENTQDGLDFGDAPENNFPVLLDDDGARHIIDGFTFLGNYIDAENDGLPANDAKGDDNNNLDDEDGVVFLNRIFVGSYAFVKVSASTNGFLNGWADFNRDGDWLDSGEQIFDNQELSAGENNLQIEIPENANTGNSFMRFRFSSEPGLSYTGQAPDGEVEDYRATIYPDWNYTNTQITHIIMIPTDLLLVNPGDMLAVFYSGDGSLKSAGNVVYQAGQPGQLIAYGDDPSTPDVKEGFDTGETLQWKLFHAATGNVYDIQVEYDQLFPDHEGTFSPFGLSAITEIQYDENPCPMPAGWEYQVTGQVHTVNIPLEASPAILGEPLATGDWIGAFYKNSDDIYACAGAGQWTGATGILINVYGDDPFTGEKDGFETGEQITWNLFRCADSQEFEAAASYNPALPCEGNFGDFCLSELTSLDGMYFSHYPLSKGWNSISSFLVPLEPDVEDIFSDYSDELIIIKNLESIYWPYAGVNTIGDWDNYSGYALKLEEGIDLKISGEIFADTEITLDAGWHYLPVLADCSMGADDLFGEVADKITIVQDLIGTRVWWPDQNIFTLQEVMPGKAYKIRVTGEITIVYPICDGDGGLKKHSGSFEDFSTMLIPDRTPYSHTVSFHKQAISDLPSGNYIGALDGEGNLFGVMKIEHDNHNQAMVIIGDDPVTREKEGFLGGEKMHFALLNEEFKHVDNLEVAFEMANGFSNQYADNGLSVAIGVSDALVNQQLAGDEITVFPNPSSGIFSISGLGENAEIEIFDTYGKLLNDCEISPEGELNLSQQPAGIYYLRISSGSSVDFKKLILK